MSDNELRLRATAMALIAQAEAQAESGATDRPHIVRVHDPETGHERDEFWGPYPNAVSAMEAADRLMAGLNTGITEDDPLWLASVHPLHSEANPQ